MQKIYLGKQLPDLYHVAERYDHLTAVDHIDRAGRAFIRELQRYYTLGGTPIFIFAGAGRCGAYALRIASLLAQRGYQVKTYLFYRKGVLSTDCEQLRLELEQEGDQIHLEEIFTEFTMPRIQAGDLVIDGLFGAELQTPLGGGYASVVQSLNNSRARIVSIEIPSGLFAEDNSGNTLEHVIRAHRTIAFDAPKLAFFFRENAPFVGEWSSLTLGISPQAQQDMDTPYYHVQDVPLSQSLLPRDRFGIHQHREKVLLFAREEGALGRTLLATRAALSAGAWEVCASVSARDVQALQLAQPELYALSSENEGDLLLSLADYRAVAVSEGFGTDLKAKALFEQILVANPRALLLDGDAVELIAQDRKLLEKLPERTILLVTTEELNRIFGSIRTDRERLELVLELAHNRNIYVILRDAYSVVCTPTRSAFFDTTGNTGLQAPGAKSVLSGVILSLLGQEYEPITAAILGLHLVGLSAELYAGRYSERSLTASSLVSLLGEAYRQLESQ